MSVDFRIGAAFLFVAGLGETAQAEPFKTPVTIGKSAQAFAPAGFKVESETKTDLTGDEVPDLVVVLVTTADDGAPGTRGLLFLRGAPSGDLSIIGSSDSVLPGPNSCGMNGGDCTPEIVVKKTVVSFTVEGGSRETWRRTLRFRPNPATGKVELIGKDEVTIDRATLREESTSINFVNGDRVVSVKPGTVDDEGNPISPKAKTKTTKDKAPVKLEAIEAVSL